jgi:hypothetical protein
MLWQLAQGKLPQAVAEVTGYSRGWIYELVWGYNRDGAASLGDGQQQNPGAPRINWAKTQGLRPLRSHKGIVPEIGFGEVQFHRWHLQLRLRSSLPNIAQGRA